MAENHITCANCDKGLTPHFVGKPGVWVHMYSGLISCGSGLKTGAELRWHSITQVLQAYERHELRESELILVLGTWEYETVERPLNMADSYEFYLVSWPGTLDEVVDANRDGRIPDHVYDAIIELAAAADG